MSEMLVGWKEIAAHLHASKTTAQRYHRAGGMPVMTTIGTRVRTTTGLIDRWITFMDQVERKTRALMRAAGKEPKEPSGEEP